VQRLTDSLEDGLDVEAEERADARSRGGAEVGDMVDLVRVQADGAHQVDLDLVTRCYGAHQLCTRAAGVLGHRQDRRNIVAGMRVLGGEEGVVKIELTNRDAVRPRGPLR
jgi:hypothetical protein